MGVKRTVDGPPMFSMTIAAATPVVRQRVLIVAGDTGPVCAYVPVGLHCPRELSFHPSAARRLTSCPRAERCAASRACGGASAPASSRSAPSVEFLPLSVLYVSGVRAPGQGQCAAVSLVIATRGWWWSGAKRARGNDLRLPPRTPGLRVYVVERSEYSVA